MFSWLSTLLKGLLGESVARMLTGAGLSVVSYAAILPIVMAALNAAAAAFRGINADALNLILLFGIGEAISAIGAAMLTRMAISSASVGLKKAAA